MVEEGDMSLNELLAYKNKNELRNIARTLEIRGFSG